MTELLHSAITKGSRRTYERAWKTYVEFSSEFCDSRRSLLPVSVNNLALFISYLSAKKFASSTISTYVSALSYVHKLGNFEDPTKNFLVQKLLTAHSKLQRVAALSAGLKSPQFIGFSKIVISNHVFSSLLWLLLTVKGANLKSLVRVQDLHFQFSNNVVTSATIVLRWLNWIFWV